MLQFSSRIVIGKQMLDFSDGLKIRRGRAVANSEWAPLMLAMLHHRCAMPSEVVGFDLEGETRFFYRGTELKHWNDPASLSQMAERSRYEAAMAKVEATWTEVEFREFVWGLNDGNGQLRQVTSLVHVPVTLADGSVTLALKAHRVHYDAEGRLHRLYGPAIENALGMGWNQWWVEGKKHRDPKDGPALEFPGSDGLYCWNGAILHKDGKPMTRAEAIEHVHGVPGAQEPA